MSSVGSGLQGEAHVGRRVTVFRERVLPGSETFIRNQLDSMRQWTPTLVGLDRIESTLSRATDEFVFSSLVGARRRLLKSTGRSPALTAKLLATRANVVHAHFGSDATLVLDAVHRMRVPLIVTFHGVDVTVWPHRNDYMARRYQSRMPRLFDQADRLIAVSDFIASRLVALGAVESKVRVLPIGVPLPPRSPFPPSERRGVLFVGRLMPVKGLDDGLRAFSALASEIRARHPLTVIGDGPERARLRSLAAELGVSVTFLGSVPPGEVAQRMNESAVLLAPSKTAPNGAQEAFGMVFLEAAAAGLPAVAYRSGGVGEAVVHGRTGLLAPEGDARELAANLLKLLSNVDLRSTFGINARKRVVSSFDINKQTALLETEYDRLRARPLS